MSIEIDELRLRGNVPDTASDLFLGVTSRRAGVIQGEVTTDGHEGEIGVYAWGWGVTANAAIGSTQPTGRRLYKHLVVWKGIDSASTGLMSSLASNDEIREARLTMRKAGGTALPYFTMKVSNARIVAVDIEVGQDGRPRERVEFAYNVIDVEYEQQDAGGASSGGFAFADDVRPDDGSS